MKPFLLLSVLALASCGTPQEINRNTSDFILGKQRSPLDKARAAVFPTETERAFQLERRADLVVSYSGQGAMRVDAVSGKPVDSGISPAFLDRQKRKSLVVVLIQKSMRSHEEQEKTIAYLNGYFSRHGYRRVVIHLAPNNPNGRPTLSDTARPGSSRPKFQRRWER